MKRVNLVILKLVAVCLLATALASGQAAKTGKAKGGNVEEEVESLQSQLVQALLKADTSFLEKYYADDITIVHSDGKLSTKAQEIANMKSGSLKYESIKVNQRNIHTYGDTVVVNAEASVKDIIGGTPFGGEVRATRVWVKRNGNWRLIVFHVTRVAPGQ